MVATALPLIRQHAFEAHLSRTLKAIDADGLIDARTGLLTPEAFERDFASAIYQTQQRGGGLSVARFAFDPEHPRAQFDGARIISRLMRQMDFGAAQEDGSVVVVFAETDLKTAHTIARRLSSVMRHTSHGQPRRTIGAGRHGRNAAAERFREVAAVAAPGRGASRRVVIVPCDLTGTTILTLHCRVINSALEDNMKKIALITASLALLASPAFAEEAKTVGAAPAEAKFSTVSKDEMFSSKLKGLNVYNQKDESVGEITDIAIKGSQVDALILSVGGFLGMGEHYVAVSPSSVSVKRDTKNDKWVATMNTTKEALKAAPEFKYPK